MDAALEALKKIASASQKPKKKKEKKDKKDEIPEKKGTMRVTISMGPYYDDGGLYE